MREILIFLGGAMFGSLVAFFTLCLLTGVRLKDDERYRKKNDKEGQRDV